MNSDSELLSTEAPRNSLHQLLYQTASSSTIWYLKGGGILFSQYCQGLTSFRVKYSQLYIHKHYINQYYHLHVPTVLKSVSLNLLEPSGPVQLCNGIALPFHINQ